MSQSHSGTGHFSARVEALLYWSNWPVRLARRVGVRPQVKTIRHSIPVYNGTGIMPPVTLAFASDFHAGPTTDPAVLREASAALRAAAPDVLLLGGDFVTFAASDVDWLAHELGSIPAPLGRFAVLGNHDYWSDGPYIVRRLEAAGIRVLTNSNMRLEPPFDNVWICGIDDHWCGRPDAAAALSGADGIRVVLMHAPSGLLDLGGERFDLALCGHTHGGQLALPGGVPIVVPHGRLSRRYSRGRHEVGAGRTLVVSVGVGCVVLPLRLFADPEIVVCNLTNASGTELEE